MRKQTRLKYACYLPNQLRILIKFGYFGWQFTGFQRGNGTKSVEDTILKVLEAADIAKDIHTGARTDRGVSAISNTMAVDTDSKPEMVLGILNGKIPHMVFHSYSVVPDDFNPRHCDKKTYRYIVDRELAGPFLRKALKPFRGKHDFQYFCKMDQRNPVRTINSITIKRKGGRIFIDYRARSFLWNQIRTITAFALENSFSGERNDPFSLTEKFPRLMEPDGLILLDMEYPGVEFSPGISTSKRKQLTMSLNEHSIRNDIMGNFTSLLK